MKLIIIILFCVVVYVSIKSDKKESIKQNNENALKYEQKNSDLNKKYSDLSKKYYKYLRKIKTDIYANIVCVILTDVIIFFVYSITGAANTLVWFSIFIILNCVFIAITIYILVIGTNKEQEYKKEFKAKMNAILVQDVDKNLYYVDYENPTNIKPLTNEECMKSRLFNTLNPNLIEDNIVGVLEDKSILRMCNYIPQMSYRNDAMQSDSESATQGLFIDIKINKDIGTVVKVTKKKKITKDKNYLVSIDNENFEKLFDVYAEDANMALRILTADVMEYMVNFRKNNDYKMSIVNNHIYLKFSTGPIFEPRTISDSIDYGALESYTKILKFVLEISNRVKNEIEELEL